MEVDGASASGSIALAVVMPVYNEATHIESVFEEWYAAVKSLGTSFRFVLVDDGSTDGTGGILDQLETGRKGKACAIRQRNQGHGRACRAGYEAAIKSGAAYVLQVDSDGQCDPAYLPRFWASRSGADCVFGQRVEREDGWVRDAISRLCSATVTFVVGKNAGDANVPYRLMRSDVLRQALARIPEQFDMQNVALTVILGKTSGVRFAHVPIRFRRRHGGESNLNVWKIAALGSNMLRQLRWLKN